MAAKSAIRNPQSAIRRNRTGNDDRLEIRLPATLLAELQAHVAGRTVPLAEWCRLALEEKLAADRRQARWQRDRQVLNELARRIAAMPPPDVASVQAKLTAHLSRVADSASSDRTDKWKENNL